MTENNNEKYRVDEEKQKVLHQILLNGIERRIIKSIVSIEIRYSQLKVLGIVYLYEMISIYVLESRKPYLIPWMFFLLVLCEFLFSVFKRKNE